MKIKIKYESCSVGTYNFCRWKIVVQIDCRKQALSHEFRLLYEYFGVRLVE